MTNIIRIFLSDVKRLSTNVVAVVVIIGLSVIPCLYAWFNILSNWAPYNASATGHLAVAVVSMDQFTASSAGTSIYCLEYTQNHTSLDSGFILYAHADEDLQVTFDLVWYSFSDCVAAPDGVPEAEATVTVEQAAERAASAAETYDSCVRTNNMIGAAAEMVEGAYWEAYVMDSSIAGISGNGGSFYHENYADYAWDVFTIEPVSPGRTSAYFVYRTGDDAPMPRIQVADIQVAEDMTVTIHVRRFDMGVEFD